MTTNTTPTPVELRLPPGAEVYNFLYRTANPVYLVQDILTVRLTNGYCIDAGWFPEHDPQGAYSLRVFLDTPDRQMGQKLSLRNIDQLIQAVQQLAWHYSGNIAAAASGQTNDIKAAIV